MAAGTEHARPGAKGSRQLRVEVDRVGRDQAVGLALQQGRLQRLVQPLQALLAAQVADQAQGDAGLVAEPLQRHPQELGRAVGDQDPDLAIEDAQAEPVGQDPRPARVIDE